MTSPIRSAAADAPTALPQDKTRIMSMLADPDEGVLLGADCRGNDKAVAPTTGPEGRPEHRGQGDAAADDPSGAGTWVAASAWALDEYARDQGIHLLRYDPDAGCWAYDLYLSMFGEAPERRAVNPTLTSPISVAAAQQWIVGLLTHANSAGFPYLDEPASWTITEWRLVDAHGTLGWMPLFDVSDLARLPFPAQHPFTGGRANPATDNRLRVIRDRGHSSPHPLGTELVRATHDDIGAVAAFLAGQLERQKVAAWLVPDPRARKEILTAYLEILVEHAITSGHGHIDLILEYHHHPLQREQNKHVTAAAAWLYEGAATLPIPYFRDRVFDACHEHPGRFFTLHEHLYGHDTGPGHHLLALAVAEPRRGNHLAGMLLRAHLALIDSAGIAADALAVGNRARRFYRGHGFADQRPLPRPPGARRTLAASPIWRCHRPPHPSSPEAV